MSQFNFKDITDNLAGENYRSDEENSNGIVISIQHLASGERIEFKAFLESFEDQFTQNWNEQEIFGRMDQVQTYKNTTRKISFSWTVPAHSQDEAISNFQTIQSLAQFHYPVFEPVQVQTVSVKDGIDSTDIAINAADAVNNLTQALNNGSTSERNEAIQFAVSEIENGILSPLSQNGQKVQREVGLISSPPILRMKFMNWMNSAESNGLYGRIAGFSFSPDLDNGTVFMNGVQLIPMFIKCSLELTVIHTDKLGWSSNDRSIRTKSYPYGV